MSDSGSLLLVVVLVAATLVSSLLLVQQLRTRRRLRRLTTAAEDIAAGRNDVRVAAHGDSPTDRVGRALNAIAAASSRSRQLAGDEREHLVSMLDAMADGVVTVDRLARVTMANRAAIALLELEPDCVGRPAWECVRNPVVRASLRQTVAAAVEGSGAGTTEVCAMTQVGSGATRRFLEVRARPFGAGGNAGSMAVLHDVSDQQATEQLRRDFVANVSHELNTPLAALRALLDTMSDDPEMATQTRRDFLARAQGQADRLELLVRDLLTLSRVEAQPPASHGTTPTDLRLAVRQALSSFEQRAAAAGVTLHEKIADQELPVAGDPELVRRVASNLIDNAVKYTPAGGAVTVSARREGESAVVDVRDTGVGIAAEHHTRIFERFYRADESRTHATGGTGLGLAIVRHSVNALGGQIHMRSAPGAGSSFRVQVPIARPDTASEASDSHI